MPKKYEFNGKEYKFRGKNSTGYSWLIYDVFKYYLNENKHETYQSLKRIFNPIHCNLDVVLNEDDYKRIVYDKRKVGSRVKGYV